MLNGSFRATGLHVQKFYIEFEKTQNPAEKDYSRVQRRASGYNKSFFGSNVRFCPQHEKRDPQKLKLKPTNRRQNSCSKIYTTICLFFNLVC